MIAPSRNGTASAGLAEALRAIAASAGDRDRDPRGRFPEAAVAALERAGALAGTAGTYADELRLLRAVAGADAGVGRILDGHLNAVERLRVQAPAALRDAELALVAAGRLRAGVWGADPGDGEGPPAWLDGATISGVKTFCSGAGGLHRALVLVRDAAADGPPLAAWVDLTAPGTVEIDRSWFRAAGMRSSASHRVIFTAAPVLAILGDPGALTEQPWFARDAVRTAATWVGAADAATTDALTWLATREPISDLEALAAGRLETWRHGLGLWLDDAGHALDADPTARALDGDADAAARTLDAGATTRSLDADPAPRDPALVAAQLRAAVADGARAILDEAERATGSRPPTTGATLDRAARDLRLFLLQHRLEPILARAGRARLEARR
ncbi:MAG TPA: hypothetical protein VGM33_09300 [Baekduia sp.]